MDNLTFDQRMQLATVEERQAQLIQSLRHGEDSHQLTMVERSETLKMRWFELQMKWHEHVQRVIGMAIDNRIKLEGLKNQIDAANRYRRYMKQTQRNQQEHEAEMDILDRKISGIMVIAEGMSGRPPAIVQRGWGYLEQLVKKFKIQRKLPKRISFSIDEFEGNYKMPIRRMNTMAFILLARRRWISISNESKGYEAVMAVLDILNESAEKRSLELIEKIDEVEQRIHALLNKQWAKAGII